jgi:hypothetical protein
MLGIAPRTKQRDAAGRAACACHTSTSCQTDESVNRGSTLRAGPIPPRGACSAAPPAIPRRSSGLCQDEVARVDSAHLRRGRPCQSAAWFGLSALMDPAGAHPRVPCAGADAQDADRSAHRLAAACAGAALPAGSASGAEIAQRDRPAAARGGRALRGRARAGRARAADDRCPRPAAGATDPASSAYLRAARPACRALIASLYGVGPVSVTAILAELGDARRFSSSDDTVRHAGQGS